MGISLEQYRLRVGLYPGGGTGSAYLKSSTTPIGHGRLALICLLLLLLISGIEPNPGPQYTCKQCHIVSGSVEAYFNHQKEKHCNVSCLNEDCQFKTSNLALYSVHCSRNHASSSSNPYPDVMCPVPNCQIPQRRSMKEHLEEHLDINQSFQCPFGEACKAVFTKKLSFRTHLSQVHQPKTQPSRKASTPASASGTQEILLPPNEFPPNKIKYDVAKFYLALEGFKILPSSTVQFISEAVAFFTEMSHHCLQRALLTQLFNAGIKKEVIDVALRKTFCVDPIFNMHHKGHDPDQVSTIYFRSQQLQKYFAYVPSKEIQLPRIVGQKNRVTRYVPLRASLESVFQDSKVRSEVLQSFTRGTDNASKGILEDFTDGSAFQEHLVEHGFHKCIHLIFFIDAFEFSPFGPAKGLYKTHGVYFTIGNISAEFRSKIENILLAALLLDENLKSTEEDHLSGVDKFEQSLGLLIKDLKDLKSNGIVIDGEMFPVCFLFCTGDNLGANQLGSFIQSFTGHCCRFCTISMKDFKDDPFQSRELRNPENYDQSVILAKEKWDDLKEKSISFQTKQRTIQAQQKAAGKEVLKPVSDSRVSKSALKKLQQINHMGVKPFPSVLNQIPGFHVAKNGLPSCLAHDIFEGVADIILAGILKHFIEEKKWFSLCTLNRRIKSFKYKGKDEADAPSKIKSLDSIKGSAVETWTLIRLLPFLIEDLVQDKEDKYWILYLDLKSITEYVCAPKIRKKQVAYLKPAINSFLSTLKSLLPECLTPKAHFLSHYPALILIYGPLIRLWTMRFESRHVFFKAVARASRSFKNILLTLAKKYQFRFAYDHLSGFIPLDVTYEEGPTEVNIQEMPTEVQDKLTGRAAPESQETKLKSVREVVIKSVLFKNNQWMMLDKVDVVDLKAGQIMKILVYPNDNIHLVMRVYTAEKTPNGYYVINESHFSYEVIAVDHLPDFEPLPAYNLNGRLCISLKHSLLCMGL